MTTPSARLATAAGEFLLLAVLALVPAALVYIDVAVIGNEFGELSVTEITQETLLLITALIYWYGAWRHPNRRGFLLLVAGFLSCALIRELGDFLDAVWQGFWFWPAILLALGTIASVVACCRTSVTGPMSRFVQTKPYYFLTIGLIVLLVFSRTFGSGGLLWKDLLGARYTPQFKNALQEGLELLGYLFIAYGSFVFLVRDFDDRGGRVQGHAP